MVAYYPKHRSAAERMSDRNDPTGRRRSRMAIAKSESRSNAESWIARPFLTPFRRKKGQPQKLKIQKIKDKIILCSDTRNEGGNTINKNVAVVMKK